MSSLSSRLCSVKLKTKELQRGKLAIQMFQIRKMDGSKSTGIIVKIVGVSEHVHNGETTITVHYDHGI